MRRGGVVALALLLVAYGSRLAHPAETACPGERDRPDTGWALSTTTFDPAFFRHPFVGNGYLGQRVPPTGMGYVATGEETGWPLYTPRYDGAFVAGLYGQDNWPARQVIAAVPTWSTLTVGTGDETFTTTTPAGRISNFRQSLFLRCGLLRTSLTWTTSEGTKSTDLVYDVIAHRVHEHVGAVRLTMTPHWRGEATVTDLLDGAGARRILQTGGGARPGDATVAVTFRTATTDTAGAVASTLRYGPGVQVSSTTPSAGAENLTAGQTLAFRVETGQAYEFVKYVGVDTALTSAHPEESAVAASQQAAAEGWPRMFAAHAAAWADLWHSDIVLSGRPDLQALQGWIRGGMYGLLSSLRQGQDTSIAPAGLTSDNYAGLIFWDAEIWMYPPLLAFHPDIARSVLEYRYRTLGGARANAEHLGYQGVFYPWTSASEGDLGSECHSVDPRAPHCRTQIHLQGDIALAVWHYYLATKDRAWLAGHGWPMLKGIAEFWAGRVTPHSDGSYSMADVAGPDEYSNGVTDGVYTNAVAAMALRHAALAAEVLGEEAPAQWTTIADELRMPFDDQQQVFLQYDGYAGSKIKQADTVLLVYPLEWPMAKQVAANTLAFYAPRADPDGPAMTDSVHAIAAAALGEPGCATHTYLMRSIKPFVRHPFAQFSEARGAKAGAADPLAGAPAFTFLTGSGGFTQIFTNGLTGLRWREDRVHLDPMLPPQLEDGVTVKGLHWQGRTFDLAIGSDETTVTQTEGQPFPVESPEGTQMVSTASPLTLKTRRPDLAATDNVARCAPAQASTEEPGKYAEAAVDGSDATAWVPHGVQSDLTVDLGRPTRVARISARWNETPPASSRVETSLDGWRWTEVSPAADTGQLPSPVLARHVRIHLQSADPAAHPGIRELEVIRAS